MVSEARSTVDPLTCVGYPEPRVFLESQSWWMPSPGESVENFGHVHVGTCFPLDQTISGDVDFDIRIIMHDNPGTLERISPRVTGDGFNELTGAISGIGNTCPEAQTCTWWFHTTLDTTVADHDGREEIRFLTAVSEPDGQEMHVSTGWQVYLDNGAPEDDYRPANFYEARGWYTGADYTNARLKSAFPFEPVSGIWSPSVDLKPGSGGIPVTHHSVNVDPSFHAGNPGVVIRDGTGPYSGQVEIDTTLLSDGPHRLVLKSDADCIDANCGAINDGHRNSGLFVIPFVVQNGGEPPGDDSGSSSSDDGGTTGSSGDESTNSTGTTTGTASGDPPQGEIIVAAADTYVRGGSFSDQSYGGDSELRIKDASADYTREAFARFDGPSLGTVSQATLWVHVNGLPNGTPVPISVGGVLDDQWDEATMTWNVAPQSSTGALDTISVDQVGWFALDVTDFVAQQAAEGDQVISLMLWTTVNLMAKLGSRETLEFAPYLEILP